MPNALRAVLALALCWLPTEPEPLTLEQRVEALEAAVAKLATAR